MKYPCDAIAISSSLTLYHLGPALEHGPLPSLFYFALSGQDSLTKDPYNQLVALLGRPMMRVFSLTLPGHEEGLPDSLAMKLWAEDMEQHGGKKLQAFFSDMEKAVSFALDEKLIHPEKMAAAGLSRGGFIAAHLAAKDPRFKALALLAPLTRLSLVEEFTSPSPLIDALDLHLLAKSLASRPTWISIGNRDTRVGTTSSFELLSLISQAKERGFAPAEMHIHPSIGHKGHGTPPEIFKAAADWIKSQILSY